MRLRSIFFVLLWCTTLVGFSQSAKVDSLQHRLSLEKVDTTAINILLDISFEYRNSKPDSTIYFAQEAHLRAEEVGFLEGSVLGLRNIGLGYQKKGAYDSCIAYVTMAIERAGNAKLAAMGDAYNTLGTTFYFTGEYDSAIVAFEKGAAIFEEFEEWSNQAGNFANIGVIAETQGNNLKALEFYQRALTIFEQEKSADGIANVQSNMASILEDQDKFDEALVLYNKTLKHDLKNNNLLGAAITTGSIAGIKKELGDCEEAIQDYRKSLAMFKKADANCRTSLALNNIGKLHLTHQSMDSAKYYFSQALIVADSCDVPENKVAAHLNLGDYYLATEQSQSARNEFLTAFTLANDIGLQREVADASQELFQIEKNNGNTELALKYLEVYSSTFKTLYNEENARKTARIQAEYEFSKQKEMLEYETQIRELTLQNELSQERGMRNTILVILVLVVLLMILLGVMYFQRLMSTRKLNQFNHEILSQQKKLHQKNKELTELNEEKNTLIGIVAHDLKQPINQIRGLLQIMQLEGETYSKNTRDYLDLMDQSSARSVEMIERILDINAIENKTLEIKNESFELKQLVRSAVIGFESQALAKNIAISNSNGIEDGIVNTDPLLLREVIDNLLSNAIKFSPPNAKVHVASQRMNGHYIVKIKDEGPGISKEDQKQMFNKYQKVNAQPTANEKSTGLGLAIVKKYAGELGYQIECNSEGFGTEFSIFIPA